MIADYAITGYVDAVKISSVTKSTQTTTATEEINEYDGTYVNTPTLGETTLLADGYANTSISTDSTNSEYVNLDACLPALSISTDYTFVFMFNTTSKPASVDSDNIMLSIDGTSDATYFEIGIATSGKIYLDINSLTFTHVLDTVDYADGEDHIVFCLFDYTSPEFNLYIDNELITTITTGTAIPWNTVTNVSLAQEFATSHTPSSFYDGGLDETIIYNKLLTSAQIAKLTQLALLGSIATDYSVTMGLLTPVGYWRLGEINDATVASDEIGTDNGVYVDDPYIDQLGLLFNDTNTSMRSEGVTLESHATLDTFVTEWKTHTTGTVSFVANIPTSGSAMIAIADSLSDNYYIYFQVKLTEVTFRYRNSTNATGSTDNYNITWYRDFAHDVTYHFVFVHNDTGSVNIYINGVDIGVTPTVVLGTASGKWVNDLNAAVDSAGVQIFPRSSALYYTATVDELGIFDRKLTHSEVYSLYTSGTDSQHLGYDSAINALSPLMYYELDEDYGTTTLTDTTGTYDGTYTADVPLGSTPIVAGTDNSSGWNGDSTHYAVTTSNIAPDLVDSVVGTFAKSGNNPSGVSYSICHIGNNSISNNQGFNITIGGNNRLYFSWFNGTWQSVFTNTLIQKHRKYHFAVVRESSTSMSIYLDGVLDNTATVTNTTYLGTVQKLRIGCSYANNVTYPFNGRIAKLAFFDSKLTSTNVSDLYALSTNTTVTYNNAHEYILNQLKPAHYYRMGEAQGSICYDFMGRENGSYSGSPTFSQTSLVNDTTNDSIRFASSSYANISNAMKDMRDAEYGTVAFVGITDTGEMASVYIGDASYNDRYVQFQCYETGVTYAFKSNNFALGVENFSVSKTGVITQGQIFTVAFVQDPTAGVLIYLNGTLLTGMSTTGTPNDKWWGDKDEFDTIGVNSLMRPSQSIFAGEIDEIVLSTERFTATEVSNLHNLWTTGSV